MMKKGIIKKALFTIIILLFMASIIVVNREVTRRLKKIERGYMITRETAVPAKQPPSKIKKLLPVKIDPFNDPLAPRKKEPKKILHPKILKPEVHEGPMNTSTLIQ